MDPSSDYHFLNQILWRRVKLTLVCGIFEGVLQHVDPNKIVVLKKVKNVETDRSVPGVKMFFGHEIVNVELLDEEEQGAVREKASSVSLNTERNRMDTIKDEDLNVYKPASPACEAPTTSLLNDLKYSPSEEEEVTYTVVDQFQQKFGAAMLHIKKQSVLSVAAEGANVCRHGRLCWLQVATNRRVYLFDIFLLGSRAFSNGLQMVLEDKRILKVIHDCRWLSDCLSHQYGILLNNVFDTQVADVLQFSMETGGFLPNCISTLQESLIRHLKIAPKYLSFLEERQKLIRENPELWFTRPISPSLLKILALEATYLLPLRLVLLDEMMSDLTTLVDGYLNTYRKGSADWLGGMELTCMELPEELLQLKDFQRQRRERAAKEYRVNEQGLLIRTELHPKKSMTETAGKEGKVRDFLLCKNSRLDKAPHFTSHKDVNLLNEESKSKQTTAEPQHLPPIKEEVSEDSSNKRICPESEGFKDQRITQKEYLKIPKQEFQTNLSLKEEIEQLLMVENKEDLKYTKQDVLVSPSLPQETRVSPSDIFHPFRKAVLPTLPPCPALEKTDSWINPDSPNLP
ncbi:piRNA biogenesis protein EXD1 isoform X1 [Physeter macrocephalus]|uniref:piRNA biogenesis protein EXD1 n=2 Tax=Physeter macrocephalus TaxID=9755 RepID=A0A2Y9EYR4_PHYMC|nr:piRNA biogenesis protein EXD1 isoform X1 [Physeter catodon]XP_007111763.1 piRNA biogenesis protein EXD1 isoform X1 [Physeter catodon]XP_028351261.1 piRNA biogenesis protein EXD1 isoform X1 [Physeter catodon]XP_028351262.1 piRNA biogenesis protein EXD1 isoform X1 [Physeter catodon]XP_028351263.1 piRNA biogenesis protein EXD1 isoform X1 [Physeter catodon]|eukprot:XP_007111762.1 piRNA biogenesis protein EXD1 isoform X1 [Physeter catodon]